MTSTNEHVEHVTVDDGVLEPCQDRECEHEVEECPRFVYEVCVQCMVDDGRGADPEGWQNELLWPWPHDAGSPARFRAQFFEAPSNLQGGE